MKRWGSRTKAHCCLRVTIHNCMVETQLPDTLGDDRWLLLSACEVLQTGRNAALSASAWQGSLLICQISPVLCEWRSALSNEMYCSGFGIPACKCILMLNNQQTINTGKNAKEFGLNILNTLRSFWMVFHSQDVYTCLVCVLFWQPLSPVCLLIEILIEISEGDFNHRGVVHAYLSEPQRKKEFPAGAVTRLIQQPLSGRNVP